MLALVVALSTTACGGSKKTEADQEKPESIELKPASDEVSGELEGCFTVVDRTYKVKFESFIGGIITVELKRTDDPLPFDTEGRMLYHMGEYSASPYVQVGFGIELLDADGNVVDKTSATDSGLSGSYSPEEAVELVKLSEGKTGTIRFRVDESASDAVSFRISSAYEYGGSEKGGDSDIEMINEYDNDATTAMVVEDDDYSSSNASKSSGKLENWDSVLDAYDKFADKYIALYKKVKDGTLSVTSPEYLEYSQQALEFSDKLSNAESDMTTAQIMRMNKIAAKIAAAM